MSPAQLGTAWLRRRIGSDLFGEVRMGPLRPVDRDGVCDPGSVVEERLEVARFDIQLGHCHDSPFRLNIRGRAKCALTLRPGDGLGPE